MPDLSTLFTWAKYLGLMGSLVYIWIVSHNSWKDITQQLMTMLKEQNANTLQAVSATTAGVKELTENIATLASMVSKLEEKINSNWFCPWIREELEKRKQK